MVYRTANHLVDFDYTIRPMTEADLTQAHQLSIGVGWPHRPEDWRFIFELGHGFVACDAIGRALGSAMWWPFGDHLAMVGMVIISPRLQAQGAGRRLMDTIFAQTGSRDLRLVSTNAGYRLYQSLDFEPVGHIFRHQGWAESANLPPHPIEPVRIAEPTDLAAISALDRMAYGADRTRVMEALLAQSVATVVERNGEVAGFAACRRFGRGHAIGPIVAPDDATAIALTRPHVEAHEGAFLRVDSTQEQGSFATFLENSGMTMSGSATTMIRGASHDARGSVRTFALVNQAIG